MSGARMLHIGLDACDLHIASELAASGDMPTLARLLENAAVVETVAPPGVFASGAWVTFATGQDVVKTGYFCGMQLDAGTYDRRHTSPADIGCTPYWQRLSDAGHRVAVFDVPHAIPPASINGVMVTEWGCHDRHVGTASVPAELLAELDEIGGPHVGRLARPASREADFSPCDYTEQAGDERTPDEEARLLDVIRASVEAKARASLHLLQREHWDCFTTVLGESHCVGHQLWHVHDSTHPRHDPEVRARIGDPVVEVYKQLDEVLGEHLAVADDAVVFVHLSHGMQAHYDGTNLLDLVLDRLDLSLDPPQRERTRLEAVTRGAASRLLRPLRRARRRRRGPRPAVTRNWFVRRPLANRRWFQVDNNTIVGAIRFNLVDREPSRRVRRDELEATIEWLERELRQVVNDDTGRPAITHVWRCDDVYHRKDQDGLPDLFVEWDRSAPLERVSSPTIGTVETPVKAARTGDHHDRGLLLVRGPGIEPGRRTEQLDSVDLAPTIAASLGVTLPDADGAPRPDLVGQHLATTPPTAEPLPL